MKRPEDEITLGWLRLAAVLYGRIYHRIHLISPCPLPRTGPGILISNHLSGLDPVLIQAVCPRLIVWMMAAEYGRSRILRPLFRATRTIYVNRTGHDLTATRQALRALREGMIVGIFPEGRIETTGDLLPFHPGTALLAERASVPIYPVKIEGSTRGQEMPRVFLRRQEITMKFGPSVRLSPEDSSQNLRETLENL
ncbi:MAG TPA: lysophospholipid acyltransferase family protein [Tepidisphaeraceae bacterium]|jgi:1-acyl-sn-glycerol-3-phosphate acyltransferase